MSGQPSSASSAFRPEWAAPVQHDAQQQLNQITYGMHGTPPQSSIQALQSIAGHAPLVLAAMCSVRAFKGSSQLQHLQQALMHQSSRRSQPGLCRSSASLCGGSASASRPYVSSSVPLPGCSQHQQRCFTTTGSTMQLSNRCTLDVGHHSFAVLGLPAMRASALSAAAAAVPARAAAAAAALAARRGCATTSAAAAAAATVSLRNPLVFRTTPWQVSAQYVVSMVKGSLAHPWSSILFHSLYTWMPALPEFRPFHVSLLSALNLVGSHLPRALALMVCECAISKRSMADAAPPDEYLDGEAIAAAAPPLPWWQAIPVKAATATINIMRLMWLFLLFLPVIATAPLALRWQIGRGEWMEMLRKTLEKAGPAFIKWGQWAATRHDLFPPDMCTELENLQVKAPAHKFYHTRKAIEAAFGVPIFELFEQMDTTPVASGSIGQIHLAKLSAKGAAMTGFKQGTTVAVKVRHPGVGDAVVRDFATMMYAAKLASNFSALEDLRLEETLKQFAAPLKEQVDLSREAGNLSRFNHNFRKTPYVAFPLPLYPLVSPDILVETFEEGEHITRYIQSEHNPYNHRLSELGSGTMLQMMLVDNFIHSDLHPGNIMVRLAPPGGLLGLVYTALDKLRATGNLSVETDAKLHLLQRRWLQPNLVLLDVGMATELKGKDGEAMVGLFRAFAAMDGRECANWTLAFSGAEQSCPDPDGFRNAMESLFNEVRKTDELGWEATSFSNSAAVLSGILEMVRQYKVTLPGHICAVVVTTMVLEGWSNQLDPSHSVLTQVQKMFESQTVPWGERIGGLVDESMEEEQNHTLLT